ncbi:unnamed protein product [Fraxinus pennsylvanica]|uniref:Glycoside hydrolase family 19 catalytic domain-containing protein n=1 Tax=Fraxinus pennsylvanica TaxID=56036 RepID=A0AAD2A531_9LAMI|nr:unnamed protein product [Fraxinus pennsylvanica]
MFKHRNDGNFLANGFHTYEAFIAAANSFGAFGTTGDNDTRKLEIAAFLAQTSHETTCGWASAPDSPYSWGYCFKQEQGNPPDYCVASPQWPCAPAGRAIESDLLNNPHAVANDPTISFKTALWFWMTPQEPKPLCHDAISGRWTPSTADLKVGRRPGYGVVTDIINGGIECGQGLNPQVEDRIGFYKRYCDLLGVGLLQPKAPYGYIGSKRAHMPWLTSFRQPARTSSIQDCDSNLALEPNLNSPNLGSSLIVDLYKDDSEYTINA